MSWLARAKSFFCDEQKSQEVCDLPALVADIRNKLDSQRKLVYRLTPETVGAMTTRDWLALPDAVPHDDVDQIWNGPIDPVTNFPSHPNPPTATAVDDWNFGGPDDQQEGWGYIQLLTPLWLRDSNQNTGERGEVWFAECCGQPRLLQATTVNTPADDRGILDPVLLPAGIHYLYVRLSDFSANGGFQLQWSETETGVYANFNTYQGRKWQTKPTVECLEIGFCDDIPEGYDEKPPEMCDPVFTPAEGSGLSESEVLALIPTPLVIPAQEICNGDFVDLSGRSGWIHPWTPTYTANSGTIVEDWVQVSTAEVSPDCITDATINVDMGNSYFQLRNMYGRVWWDIRLLINGTAVTTYMFHKYHYEDDIGEANLSDDITPLGSAYFARSSVPAGATITVEMRRRHNFIAGNNAAGVPSGRNISGLRSHFSIHYNPTQIVTGRQ